MLSSPGPAEEHGRWQVRDEGRLTLPVAMPFVPSIICAVISVCYKQGDRLDEQYYLATHVPLVGRVWGPQGLERTEVRKLTAAADGSTPPYQIIFSAYFPSQETLQAALQHPTSAEVMNDVKNYYDGTPEIFFGEVLA